jgi:hypothetical protein
MTRRRRPPRAEAVGPASPRAEDEGRHHRVLSGSLAVNDWRCRRGWRHTWRSKGASGQSRGAAGERVRERITEGRSAKRGSVPRDEGRSATQACHVVAGLGLDPFGLAVRPEQRLGTGMKHFLSSWTGMTQACKFEER